MINEENNTTPNVEDQVSDDELNVNVETDETDLSTLASTDETTQTTEDVNGDAKQPDLDKVSEQDKINHAFMKKQQKLREEKQRADEAEAKLKEAEAKLKEATAVKRPEVPEVPDTYDTDYLAKTALRDKAIADQKEWDLTAQRKQAQHTEQVQAQQAQQVQAIRDKETKFFERGQELGLDTADLVGANAKLGMYVTPNNAPTMEYVLERPDGPLIAKYLQANVDELDKVANMPSLSAAVYIANELAVKAAKLKPATTKTPAPVDTLEGSSPPENEDPMIGGATFE